MPETHRAWPDRTLILSTHLSFIVGLLFVACVRFVCTFSVLLISFVPLLLSASLCSSSPLSLHISPWQDYDHLLLSFQVCHGCVDWSKIASWWCDVKKEIRTSRKGIHPSVSIWISPIHIWISFRDILSKRVWSSLNSDSVLCSSQSQDLGLCFVIPLKDVCCFFLWYTVL